MFARCGPHTFNPKSGTIAPAGIVSLFRLISGDTKVVTETGKSWLNEWWQRAVEKTQHTLISRVSEGELYNLSN